MSDQFERIMKVIRKQHDARGIWFNDLNVRQIAEACIEALRPELEDAERYRHVRAKPAMLLHLSNKDFDAAIDAARQEQKDV